jgi:hypothetical protein
LAVSRGTQPQLHIHCTSSSRKRLHEALSSRVDEGAQEIGAMLFADAHGFNRSGFLVHAAKKVMETESS